MRTDTAVVVGVMLPCGHAWTEIRPAGDEAPVDGEERTCCAPECYPARFPVVFTEPVEMGGAEFPGLEEP